MKRRDFLACGATLAAAPFVNRQRYRLFASQQATYSKRAIDLVTSTSVIDMLGVFKIGQTTWMQRPSDFTPPDLQRFRDSGITVFHPAVGIGGTDAYTNVLRFLGLWNGFLAHHHDSLMRVDSASALDGVKATRKIGVILGVQNAQHFRTVEDVDFFHARSLRLRS